MRPSFDRIVTIALTVQILNGGFSFAQIAPKAKLSESYLRRIVKRAGFYKSKNGQYRIR